MKTTFILASIIACSFFPNLFFAQGVDGTWVTLSSSGFSPRGGLASAVINDKIYVIDGFGPSNGNNTWLNTLEVYDPSSDSWSTPVTVDSASRRYLIAAAVANNKIYVIGGTKGTDVSLVEEYDPATSTWSAPKTTGTFTARDGLTASVVGNKIYAIGGENNSGPVNTVEVFDPSSYTWSTPTTSGTFNPTSHLTSSVVGNKIYVFGGYDGSMDLNTVEVFDPSSNIWSSPATSGTATPRDKLTSCTLDGKIYVLGGFEDGQVVNVMEVYDPVTSAWSTPVTGGTFTPRFELTCGVVGGAIYVLGGVGDDQVTLLNTNEVYRPAGLGVAKNVSSQDIGLFPNPTNGQVTAFNLPEGINQVTVTSILGQKIIEIDNPKTSELEINLSKFPQGAYYLRFSSEHSLVTKMIIRQ